MRTIMIFVCFSLFSFNAFSQVLKMKTTEMDIERPGQKTVTKYVTCYHTIDNNKKQVIYEGINPAGEKVKIVYPIKDFYQDGVTYVTVVNSKGLKEFWFSPTVKNMGYDLSDGTRLACYKMTTIYHKEY